MTLQVPLSGFAEVARSWGVKEAYIETAADGLSLTAAHPSLDRLIVAKGKGIAEEFRGELEKAGITAKIGSWNGTFTAGAFVEGEETYPYVAAVSFVSNEESPGVWVDAYTELPAPVTVLRRLFDDFRGTGELDDIAFEEFVRLAKPNVVIVSPGELHEYIREATAPDCP